MSKIKATIITVAVASAFSLTTPGKAFAVWCQADAPQVYLNMVSNFMPFVTKVLGGTGLTMEGAITASGTAIRGEILKGVVAEKSVAEGIAAYEQQEIVRDRAQDLKEALTQPATTCEAMATAGAIHGAESKAQTAAFRNQVSLMTKLEASRNRGAGYTLEESFKNSGAKYCTEAEQRMGICRGAAQRVGSTSLAGADQDAKFLFQDDTGAPSYAGDGTAQAAATASYIERVVGGVPTQELAQKGAAFYSRSPQARAYVELARRYSAMQSAAGYSLNQIRQLYETKKNLGADTMLSDIDVPGFTSKADMSMAEVVERFVALKFSPKTSTALAKATAPQTVLRDMAQMDAFSLWMSYQAMQQSGRVEALQAHQLALIADATLRPQLDAQRTAALRASLATRR